MTFLIGLGQYIRLHAPSIKHVYITNESFIVPKADNTDVVLGSVYQKGRSDTAIQQEDTESLLRRCEAFVPSIRRMPIIKVGVGIRPGRYGGHRIELGWVQSSQGQTIPIIHNYGHGPKGIALHWGSALEALRLFEVPIKRNVPVSTL